MSSNHQHSFLFFQLVDRPSRFRFVAEHFVHVCTHGWVDDGLLTPRVLPLFCNRYVLFDIKLCASPCSYCCCWDLRRVWASWTNQQPQLHMLKTTKLMTHFPLVGFYILLSVQFITIPLYCIQSVVWALLEANWRATNFILHKLNCVLDGNFLV